MAVESRYANCDGVNCSYHAPTARAGSTASTRPPGRGGDTAAVERHVSRRPEALFIGTDPAEWWQGAGSFLAAMRAQAEVIGGQVRLVPGRLRAYREGDVGWVVDDGPTLRFPDGTEVRARHTLLYRREDGEWRLVHEHVSFGLPNEAVLRQDVAA